MNVSDVLAEILVESKKFRSSEEAKQAILFTFKTEYPYWSYSQWDEALPQPLYHIVAKTLRMYKSPEIKEWIVDVPVMLARYKDNGNIDELQSPN